MGDRWEIDGIYMDMGHGTWDMDMDMDMDMGTWEIYGRLHLRPAEQRP